MRLFAIGIVMVVVATSCSGNGTPQLAANQAPETSPLTTAAVSSLPTTSSRLPPSTSSTLAVSSTSTVVPVRAPIVLGFAGDTSFTRGLDQQDPLTDVEDLLSSPDLMVVNLETAVADVGVGRPPVQKQFLFRSPPSSLGLLEVAGVDVVALANNHSLDYGSEALAQTLREVDASTLLRVGAGLDQSEAYSPLIVEVGEWTIGLVSLSRVPCDWSASGENTRQQVAWACPPFLELADSAVSQAVAASDLTVVMVHGGTEGVLCPAQWMVELEQHWAELGVDLVVDGHPHVLQGITSIERSNGSDTLVIHSTGNFAFPSAGGITANSAVFLVTLGELESVDTKQSHGDGRQIELGLRVVPLRVAGGVVRRPTPAQTQTILDQINGVSSGWTLGENGEAFRDSERVASCR